MDTKWLDWSYFDVWANELIAGLPTLTNQREGERVSVHACVRVCVGTDKNYDGVKIQDVRMREDGSPYLEN